MGDLSSIPGVYTVDEKIEHHKLCTQCICSLAAIANRVSRVLTMNLGAQVRQSLGRDSAVKWVGFPGFDL